MDPTTANVTDAILTTQTTSWGIIWLYILAVALLAFLPRFVDMFKAYKHQKDLAELLIKNTSEQIERVVSAEIEVQKLTDEQKKAEKKAELETRKGILKTILADVFKQPEGMPGIARLTIAFSIIMIVGIVLFHIVIFGGVSMNAVSSILSALIAIVGTIAGFYFGGAKAQEETKKKKDDTNP